MQQDQIFEAIARTTVETLKLRAENTWLKEALANQWSLREELVSAINFANLGFTAEDLRNRFLAAMSTHSSIGSTGNRCVHCNSPKETHSPTLGQCPGQSEGEEAYQTFTVMAKEKSMSEKQMRNTYEMSKPLHDLEGWIIFYGQQAQRLENNPTMREVFQASCETAELLLELKTLRAASTSEAAGQSRNKALLEALEAVKAERLQGHEYNLSNPLDVTTEAAAYSQAINDCEVAITELLSASSSGEQDEPSPREREFCEAMTELNDDPAFIRQMMDLFINACNERVAKGGYLNEGDVN